jgi:hypothetical protein
VTCSSTGRNRRRELNDSGIDAVHGIPAASDGCRVRRDHLVVLGADGWLVFSPPLRPGAILLIHPNGNEHPGLLNQDKLPRPFRPTNDAP